LKLNAGNENNDNQGAITIFPNQVILLGPLNVKSENLHWKIQNGLPELYIELKISYSATFFNNEKRIYESTYDMLYNFDDISGNRKIGMLIINTKLNEIT
jgi:hypothetical protein